MKTPFLTGFAIEVDASVRGHTIVTAARPETTDDEPRLAVVSRGGSRRPFLAEGAELVAGDVLGYSRLTRQVPAETTDDPSPR